MLETWQSNKDSLNVRVLVMRIQEKMNEAEIVKEEWISCVDRLNLGDTGKEKDLSLISSYMSLEEEKVSLRKLRGKHFKEGEEGNLSFRYVEFQMLVNVDSSCVGGSV